MKQNNIIIGITGGIGTGKSTVTNILIKKGYPVIDADKAAREVVEVNKPAYNDILETFGEDILNSDKTIDRSKLGQIIFSNRDLRMKLNKIVHPRVRELIVNKIKEYRNISKLIFLDIPLLIENKDDLKNSLNIDYIWVVYASEETQLKRIIKRDKIDAEMAYKKIKAQMPIEEKVKHADVVIDNTKSIIDLETSINSNINKILSK